MTGSATVTPSVAPGPGPTTTATRLRLRPGVHVAPVPHGLSVVGRGQAFVVPGSDELATTWNRLFPLLHAGADRDRLVSGPEPDDAGLLLEVLDQAGLLLDADAARALPDELAGRFPRALNYLEAFAEDPGSSKPVSGSHATTQACCICSRPASRGAASRSARTVHSCASSCGSCRLAPGGSRRPSRRTVSHRTVSHRTGCLARG